MANQQIFSLNQMASSEIDSRDLLVVDDISDKLTKNITVGSLSDSLDGTIFLSSSYASTSSQVTSETSTNSASYAISVVSASHVMNMSGSLVFALTSSYAFSVNHVAILADTFEITSSSDTMGNYGIGRSNAYIRFKGKEPLKNSYLISPLSHKDEIGSAIISNSSISHSFNRLSKGAYVFEISKLDSYGRKTSVNIDINQTESPAVVNSFNLFHAEPYGVDFASGSGVFAISSSMSDIALAAFSFNQVVSSSHSNDVKCASGSNIIATYSDNSRSSSYAERSSTSLTSSNGPDSGIIMIYAGIRPSGSIHWYNCDGKLYSTSYIGLSSSIQNKFEVAGSGSNRLPYLSSNLFSSSISTTGSSGFPLNTKMYVAANILGLPNNDEISMSYNGSYLSASYPEGGVIGSDIGNNGRAFYFNIRV